MDSSPAYRIVDKIIQRVYTDLNEGRLRYTATIRGLHRNMLQARQMQDRLLEARLLDCCGTVSQYFGDLQAARDYQERAYVLFRQEQHKLRMGRNRNNIGDTYFYSGQYERAYQVYEQAFMWLSEVKDKLGVLVVMVNLGTCALAMRRFDEAEVIFQKVFRIQEQAERDEMPQVYLQVLASVHRGMAEIRLGRGDYAAAWGHARQSVQVSEEARLGVYQAGGLFTLAHIAAHDAQTDAPPDHYFKLVDTLLSSEAEISTQARLYLQEARYHAERGQAAWAARFAREAFTRFQTQGMSQEADMARALFTADQPG